MDGLPFDAAAFESRLAWILGSPRTGSTWLLRLLIHPWQLSRSAPGIRPGGGRDRPNVVAINESHFPRHLTPLESPLGADVGDRELDTTEFIFNTDKVNHPSYCFSDAYKEVWSAEWRRLMLVRFHAQVKDVADKYRLDEPLVVIKEPNGSHGAEQLMELLPRARLVFLLRDGRDVLDSQLALRLAGDRARGMKVIANERQRIKFLRKSAVRWVNRTNAVQKAYDAHPPELRIKVRYEDLRADTFKTLKPLLDWLGLQRSDAEIQAAIDAEAFENLPSRKKGTGKGKRVARPGHWRDSLVPREQEAIQRILAPKLEELGYTD